MSSVLPEELIVEIFTRLPSKSLLRFRSVSKWLCACIGSPDFIRSHTLRSPNKAMVLQLFQGNVDYYEFFLFALPSKGQLSSSPYTRGIPMVRHPFTYCDIVGSCNGILCVHESGNTIHLWNPSIRRKVTLQSPPCIDCKYQQTIGFGFDPTIDDYKILIIGISCTKHGEEQRSSYVYTMKTDTWREIASPATPYARCIQSIVCLFSGSLHWVVRWHGDDSRDYYGYIMAFDLRSEVFSKIELPDTVLETNQVTVINGGLSLISSKDHDCWIWVRKGYNNTAPSWSFAFKLNLKELVDPIYVYQLNANDDLLLHARLKRIILYNPETGVCSRLAELDRGSFTVGMLACVESLELLETGSSCDQGNPLIVNFGSKSRLNCNA